MNKIQVTLDAVKLRNLVSKRSYQNQQGEQVEVQEVKFELIPMKEESHKTIFTSEKFRIDKTHFAVAVQTKEEREAKAPAFYVGEGFTQVWLNAQPIPAVPIPQNEEPPADDLPF